MRAGSGALAGSRERQRLTTRSRIYEAAVAEFKRVGYDAARIDGIVDAAGVAHGTFYVHFPTKQHVLLELRRRGEQRVVARLRESARRQGSIREALREILEVITAIEREMADARLGREMLTMYARDPGDPNDDSFPLVGALRPIFTRAAKRGELRRDLEPEALMMIFLHAVFGFLLATPAFGEERLEAFGPALEVLLRGMGPQDEPR